MLVMDFLSVVTLFEGLADILTADEQRNERAIRRSLAITDQ